MTETQVKMTPTTTMIHGARMHRARPLAPAPTGGLT